MANLETLELTINANAQSASQGLNTLINSLSSLTKKINEAFSGMSQLNSEIRRLGGTANSIKVPNLTAAAKTTAKKTASIAKSSLPPGVFPVTQQIPNGAQVLTPDGRWIPINTNSDVKAVKDLGDQAKEAAPAASKLKETFGKFGSGLKNLKKGIGDIVPKFNLLNRVMRIASTMLIRMGLRALFKGAKEGFNNFYEYSKATGGAFAQEMDNVYSSWNQIKNQMGASIATVFSAAIPVINSLASAAITAFNYLSQLIALLTGKSSWSRATAQVADYGKAVNKASGGSGGGGMKELLAQFDELNVIASESGGGGGGGAAAAAADAYEDMFEEITQFDEKIRAIADFVKGVIDWIKENMDLVLTAVKLIGVAILGWKISQAFDGALATLGRIMAGAALVTLGVVLDFDFGTKLGRQLAGGKSVNWGDIVEGIAGIVAAGIGGYLIGGGIGAGIGIAFAVTAMLVGIHVGKVDELDRQKWGNYSMTADEIKKYVKKQFTFDVEAEVKLVDLKLTNVRAAKAHLDTDIHEFSLSLDKIKLGVEDTETLIADAKEKLSTVIADLRVWTEEDQNLLYAYMKVMPYDEDIKNTTLSDIISADEQLNAYFENAGRTIADLYDQGMASEWKNNEKEQILALMEHLDAITSGAENEFIQKKLDFDLSSSLKSVTRDTAEAILDEQSERLTEFVDEMRAANDELVDNALRKASYAKAAGLVDEKTGKPLEEVYEDYANFLVDTFDDSMKSKLKATRNRMKTQWINTLKDVYTVELSDAKSWDATKAVRTVLQDDLNNLPAWLVQNVSINTGMHEQILLKMNNLVGTTGWELLGQDVRSKMIYELQKQFGVGSTLYSQLKNQLNVPIDDILATNQKLWDSWSAREKIKFIGALSEAYGTGEAIRTAKKAGMDVTQAINDGLNSDNKTTRAYAQKLVEMINTELNNVKGIQIDAEADLEVKIDALVNVVPQVQGGVVETAKAVVNTVKSNLNTVKNLFSVLTGGKKTNSAKKATGMYGANAGDVFIANEQGAELVGSINGKTSVANQQQIIEGIASGVERANSEQNTLLREQNNLLRGILEKDASVRIGASAALGRVARQSLDMYGSMIGG